MGGDGERERGERIRKRKDVEKSGQGGVAEQLNVLRMSRKLHQTWQ